MPETLENISRHRNVTYTDKEGFDLLVNHPLYRSSIPLTPDEEVYEVQSEKERTTWGQ